MAKQCLARVHSNQMSIVINYTPYLRPRSLNVGLIWYDEKCRTLLDWFFNHTYMCAGCFISTMFNDGRVFNQSGANVTVILTELICRQVHIASDWVSNIVNIHYITYQLLLNLHLHRIIILRLGHTRHTPWRAQAFSSCRSASLFLSGHAIP